MVADQNFAYSKKTKNRIAAKYHHTHTPGANNTGTQ
jgi:hypothetical protein